MSFDDYLVSQYCPNKAFGLPPTKCYGLQVWSSIEQKWLYKLLFTTLDTCKIHLSTYPIDTRRIVVVSKYYPYPPIKVLIYMEGTQ